MKTTRRLLIGFTAILVALLSAFSITVHAIDLMRASTCKDFELVFVRGSGESLNDRESAVLQEAMEGRVAENYANLNYAFHEIDYPAVSVNPAEWSGFFNAAGAAISGGGGMEYGKSVNQGVTNLSNYLSERHFACPETLFALSGYSQGAQVVGETVMEGHVEYLKERIVYIALFGDPKLHLPEGEITLTNEIDGFSELRHPTPDACRGENLSKWRVYVPNCKVTGGVLGARAPYFADGWEERVGVWCNNDDYICGTSDNPFDNSGHEQYAANGSIAWASREIIEGLKYAMPTAFLSDFRVGPMMDTAILIDNTGSMLPHIFSSKDQAKWFAKTTLAHGGRISLIEYGDAISKYSPTLHMFCDFSCDLATFQDGLDRVAPVSSDGGDKPEDLLNAVFMAFDELDWRYGATKNLIVLTDATYHDPDFVNAKTTIDAVRRSMEIDPVNIYVIQMPDHSPYSPAAGPYKGTIDLANGTGGLQLYSPNKEQLEDFFKNLLARPVVNLSSDKYYAEIGETITFDASSSYGVGGAISRYEWDLDGKLGIEWSDEHLSSVECTYYKRCNFYNNTSSTFSISYSAPFSGFMQVKVVDENGMTGSMSAWVEVREKGADWSDAMPEPKILENTKPKATPPEEALTPPDQPTSENIASDLVDILASTTSTTPSSDNPEASQPDYIYYSPSNTVEYASSQSTSAALPQKRLSESPIIPPKKQNLLIIPLLFLAIAAVIALTCRKLKKKT